MRRLASSLAALLLLLGSVGVVVLNREFVHIKIGPLYALEAIGVAWALLALWSSGVVFFWRSIHIHWAVLIFFCWGWIRFALDFADEIPDNLSFQMVLKHALIFVYPLFWSLAGYWLFKKKYDWGWILLILLFLAGSIPHFFGFEHSPLGLPVFSLIHVAAGPFLLVPFMLFLDRLWIQARLSGKQWLALGVLGFFTYFPYWKMYFGWIQRSSLILAVFNTLFLALLIGGLGRRRWGHALKLAGISLGVLVGGLAVSATVKRSLEGAESYIEGFYGTFEHGDDSPGAIEGETERFQARVRRIMWSSAFEQWQSAPLFGVGFHALVPKYINRTNVEGSPEPVLTENGVRVVLENNDIFPPPKHFDWKNYTGPVFPPVSGPHNSYLGIMARMGVLGLLLMFLVMVQGSTRLWKLARKGPLDLFGAACAAIVFGSWIYAFANVGLESPHHCVLLWLFYGALFAED